MSNMFYGEEINIAAVHRASELKGKITVLFAMGIVGVFLENIPMLVYGGVLISMGKVCDSYKTAGLCMLVSSVLSIVSTFIFEEDSAGSLILTIPAAVLSLIAIYGEIQGHAEILTGIDDENANKWLQLWKWMIMAYGGLIGSMVLIVILLPVGAIVAVAASIALVVTAVMKIKYLYDMDNTLKKLLT